MIIVLVQYLLDLGPLIEEVVDPSMIGQCWLYLWDRSLARRGLSFSMAITSHDHVPIFHDMMMSHIFLGDVQ